MCRYAMTTYKPHYACFECRKTFKRRLMWDIERTYDDKTAAKCPQCGALMADMGLDFEAPKKDNIKAWRHLKTLYSVGITFHSCGCSGPGYIPASKEKLIVYFQNLIATYNQNLAYWRQRVKPENESEIQREKSKNWGYISQVPRELRPKKRAIESEDAINYWIDRIKQVEQKLNVLK